MPVEINHTPIVYCDGDDARVPVGDTDDLIVAGLLLAGDFGKDQPIVLGSITFSRNRQLSNACHLRTTVLEQIPNLLHDFVFLSKEGWPIKKDLEHDVLISQILTERQAIVIRKHFDKFRAGVVTTTGSCLGFIFIDLWSTLTQVRESIDQQLRSMKPKHEYRFIERNGWPVTSSQENLLTLADILATRNITIELIFSELPSRPSISAVDNNVPVVHRKNNKSTKVNSQGSSVLRVRDESRRTSIKNLVAKTILISYVRAEAVQYAVALKDSLTNLGFSVFLDFHEIMTGTDWQDALNYAVSNCRVFVPLLTPMYGKTQWTNRQVKLADVLNKTIIPVSFLDIWPPECLAIQFATTQYISSRWVLDGEHSDSSRIWEQSQVRRVSEEIAGRCKAISKSCLPNQHEKIGHCVSLQPTSGQMVVISAHPKQLLITHQIKEMLEKEGYSVWCSVDMLENFLVDHRDLLTTPDEPRMLRCSESVGFEDVHISKVDGDKNLSSIGIEIGHLMSFSPEKLGCLKKFQKKVDEAGLVLILVSSAYLKSRISQSQIFYCEHRKPLILIKYDECRLSSWFQMLIGGATMIMYSSPQFEASIKARIKRAIDPNASVTTRVATEEAKMQYLTTFLKKHLPSDGSYVYIVTSARFQNPRSENICRAIGRSLAKMKNVTLATGGFYGSCDLIAESFLEARFQMGSPHSDSNPLVVHVVPVKDPQDYSNRARQNCDGTFEKVPYGKTIFLGDCVKERETAVARIFDIAIVVEGGPTSAHEVEEFIWNDHFVIPVISTGGTAGGQFGVPLQMLETPLCVRELDWNTLADKDATDEDVADAVVRIVESLKNDIASHAYEPKQKHRGTRKSKTTKKTGETKRRSLRDPDELSTQYELPIARGDGESRAELSDKSEENICSKWSPLNRVLNFIRRFPKPL